MKISFDILARTLLPFHKRQPVRLDFLDLFASKANESMGLLVDHFKEVLYVLKVTAQVMILENHLSKVFGENIIIMHYYQEALSMHLIVEGEENYVLFSLTSEEDPYQSVVLYGENTTETETDFVIIAPASVCINTLTKEVNKYRLAGKTYEIITN